VGGGGGCGWMSVGGGGIGVAGGGGVSAAVDGIIVKWIASIFS